MNYIMFFIIGTVMGSFYTVVGMRRPKNQSIIKPGSHCPNCNHPLKWYDLIPIISFIIRRGKCAYCKAKIGWVYPFIELLTGGLFILGYATYGFSYELVAFLTIASLLVLICVSDFKFMVILDGPLIISSVILFIMKWIFYGIKPALLALAAGIILFVSMLMIKFVGDRIFKKDSLGGGDIKLSFVIGLCLGVRLSFISLVIASFFAFPYALYCVLSKKNQEIPFGPFLALSLTVVFYFMAPITQFLSFLY